MDGPSSIMHREMMALRTQTSIWKEIDEGNRGCSNVSIEKKSNDRQKDLLCPKYLVDIYFDMGMTGVLLASKCRQVIVPSHLLYCMYGQLCYKSHYGVMAPLGSWEWPQLWVEGSVKDHLVS